MNSDKVIVKCFDCGYVFIEFKDKWYDVNFICGCPKCKGFSHLSRIK